MIYTNGSVEVKEEKNGDVTIFRIRGRLDAVSSPDTEKKIGNCIESGQHQLLFDFSEVDYISSAGMRMLLSTTKKLKNLSGKLIVFSVTPNIMDVLQMTGFDHVLDLAPKEEDALRKFQISL